MGTIYLLHFSEPYRHARHYLGYTEDLAERLERHRSGNGARLLGVIIQAGITWKLARTWAGDRDLERRLKRQKNAPARLCPICKQDRKEVAQRGQMRGTLVSVDRSLATAARGAASGAD